jgi:hypothetical protein
MSQFLNNVEEKKELAFLNYVREAKDYFVTDFLYSEKLKLIIIQALNVVLDLDGSCSGKGLMLFSKTYGQGKTLFFEIVYSRVLRKLKIKYWRTITAKDLRVLYTSKGILEVDKLIECKNLFIDDLGEEEETGKNYGDEMNVLRYVILKRYEMWINNGSKLHLTTNLSIQEIANKYDAKVADRLLGMTEIINFDNVQGSFRQVKKVRRLTEQEKKKPKPKTEKIEYDDKAYFVFLESITNEYRKTGEMIGRHWSDFWVMYLFFERKGLKMRALTQGDKKEAEGVIKKDRLNNEEKRIHFLEAKERLTHKDPLQIEKAALSVIGKEYFIKLALLKFEFCETCNLSEM